MVPEIREAFSAHPLLTCTSSVYFFLLPSLTVDRKRQLLFTDFSSFFFQAKLPVHSRFGAAGNGAGAERLRGMASGTREG